MIFIAFMLLQFYYASGQSISDIDKYHEHVDKKIDSGAFHQNQWVTNKNESIWFDAGSSYYKAETDFWYYGTGFINDETGIPEFSLVKISTFRESTIYNIKEEYLFQNRQLVFFHSILNTDESIELSFYFNSKGNVTKKMILIDGKEIEKNDTILESYGDAIVSTEEAILKAKKYQNLFKESNMMEH